MKTAPAVETIMPSAPDLLPLGLHFGLDEETYHRDPALGSTDLRRCAKNVFNYWWTSLMNPQRPVNNDDTESKTIGRAMHKLVYEGKVEFSKLYCRGPDQDGMSSSEKTQSTKKANAAAAALGLSAIKSEAYDRIMTAATMITKNPELAGVFRGGMSEVSFFFTIDGVRCKARFDYLKTSQPKGLRRRAGIGDLKSIANQHEMDLEAACYGAIANYRYDAQVAHYLDALPLLRAAVGDDLVFGDHDAAWLKRLSEFEDSAFQIIFHQTTNAPITHSMIFSPNNPIVECGRAVVRRGLDQYRYYMDNVGPESPWLLIEQPREAEIERMPGYYAR